MWASQQHSSVEFLCDSNILSMYNILVHSPIRFEAKNYPMSTGISNFSLVWGNCAVSFVVVTRESTTLKFKRVLLLKTKKKKKKDCGNFLSIPKQSDNVLDGLFFWIQPQVLTFPFEFQLSFVFITNIIFTKKNSEANFGYSIDYRKVYFTAVNFIY